MTEEGGECGHRSQGGRFLLLGDRMPAVGAHASCHIFEWQSHTIKRVCRSTLQAEVLSSMHATCEDDSLHRVHVGRYTPGSVSDKRLAIIRTSLRQELRRDEPQEVGGPSVGQRMPEQAKDQLRWICTADMISDQLTKSMRWDAIRQLADNGVFTVTVAHVRAGFSP